ncbi:hypothetical protein Tco_1267395 [Tanacetum coccineum]
MEEILKLSRKEGGLAKWAAKVRTYDISYIPRKEAEGKKFFGQGEQVEGSHTPATEHERKYKEEILDVTAPFHRYQNKTIGRRDKKQQEGEIDKQCAKSITELQS